MAKRDYYGKKTPEKEATTQIPTQVTPPAKEPEPVVTPTPTQIPTPTQEPTSTKAPKQAPAPASAQKPKQTVSTSSAPKQKVKKAPSKPSSPTATSLEYPDGLVPKKLYVWRDLRTGEMRGPVSDIWAAKQASHGTYVPVWCWVTERGEYFADFFTEEENEKFFFARKRP